VTHSAFEPIILSATIIFHASQHTGTSIWIFCRRKNFCLLVRVCAHFFPCNSLHEDELTNVSFDRCCATMNPILDEKVTCSHGEGSSDNKENVTPDLVACRGLDLRFVSSLYYTVESAHLMSSNRDPSIVYSKGLSFDVKSREWIAGVADHGRAGLLREDAPPPSTAASPRSPASDEVAGLTSSTSTSASTSFPLLPDDLDDEILKAPSRILPFKPSLSSCLPAPRIACTHTRAFS